MNRCSLMTEHTHTNKQQQKKHKEQWMEVCDIVQDAGIKTIPKKKKRKKENDCLRRPYKKRREKAKKRREAKGKGEKERHTHLNEEF